MRLSITTDRSRTLCSRKILKGNNLKEVVRAEGLEPTTYGSGNHHSIQLSYARACEQKSACIRRKCHRIISRH